MTVTLNGTNVTSAFAADPEGNHQLEGVVTGLPLGKSELVARAAGPGKSRRHRDSLTLTNHDIQGPMFSGPRQVPFVCATPNNAGGFGLPPIAQSETCETATVVSFRYRSTTNQWLDYNPASPPAPSTIQQVTTLDGETVPLIIRWERGVINRFMYSIAMLSPASQGPAPGLHAPGTASSSTASRAASRSGAPRAPRASGDMLHLAGLGLGYAVIYSTGNRTNTHYNLQLGGETAIMVKDRFVSAYAEPEYTIGVGGSGGAIQQYVYGQNHPGLLDGGVPQYSYSDMVTQTIHVGDCELLERWADSKVIADPLSMWRTWVNRSLIEGLSTSATFPNPFALVDAVHADPRLERVHQRLARPLAARAQPALRHSARVRPRRPRSRRVDALGRPREHLRAGRDRLRALAVGQRGRAVRRSRRSAPARSPRRSSLT